MARLVLERFNLILFHFALFRKNIIWTHSHEINKIKREYNQTMLIDVTKLFLFNFVNFPQKVCFFVSVKQ